ncbi:DUF2088 domain-containing protein [candidate division GN15 bacterium]|nr:DUF2088 domain-containing protein [candidate division GN15 bacterium]
MEIRLAYGKEGLTLDVPDHIEIDRFGLTAVDQPVTFDHFSKLVRQAGIDRLFDAEAPLVIVNDGYRNTPTARMQEWLDAIDNTFLDRASFLIATGTHAAPTDEHLEAIFGRLLQRVRPRVTYHDCRDLESMRPVGTDSFGQDAYLNARYLDADPVLVINSVEPHYFAGFTGGRKSLFPGLTDLATVERNHNLANSLEAQPLRLDGNPVAEHLDSLLSVVPIDKILSIQVVMDAGGRLDSIHCGGLRESFAAAVEAARELYAHSFDKPYDLVIAEMRQPLDNNLYQAQKALENTQRAVKDGGTALVVSECFEGMGSPHFFALAEQWDREKNEAKDGKQRFGSHKLSRVNLMTRRINVRLYSEVDHDAARQVFYEPAENVQRLFDETLAISGRVAVVHDAGHTVLQPAGAESEQQEVTEIQTNH